MHIHAREGDFIETVDGLIFDVKGFIHPRDRVIAYLRYHPDPNGPRVRKNVRYKKIYSLNDRFQFLKNHYPRYLFNDPTIGKVVQAVPHDRIRKVHEPHVYLERILKKPRNRYERNVLDFVHQIQDESGIFTLDMGISGSPMVGLNQPDSDIDLIIYGTENAKRVYQALHRLFSDDSIPIRAYNLKELRKLYEFKSQDTKISFEKFVEFEREKKLQGIYKDKIEFFIRNLKAWDEIENDPTQQYGYFIHETIAEVMLRAKIVDGNESIFTPCTYMIENVEIQNGPEVKKIDRIVSYRGRFTEARAGKFVHVRGTLELVRGKKGEYFYQVIVGGEKQHFLTY
ncbi:MAG: hypothetical protein ACXQS8_02840 [Candidatus Helarchaeales archaeon]